MNASMNCMHIQKVTAKFSVYLYFQTHRKLFYIRMQEYIRFDVPSMHKLDFQFIFYVRAVNRIRI